MHSLPSETSGPPTSSPRSATCSQCRTAAAGCSRYQFLSRMSPITRAQLVNQKDLLVDELAALADTIMLTQASVQSLLAEKDADRHNADVLTVRQRSSASAPPPPKEKKKGKAEECWFHQKWGKEAKSCRKPCCWSGIEYWGGTKD